MTDDFMLQASFTIPSGEQYEKGDMVNIRGRNPDEFHYNLTQFQERIAEQVARAGMELRAHALAVRELGATTIAREPAGQPQGQQSGGYSNQYQNGPQSQPQGQWQAPQDGGQGGPPQWATGQQGSPQGGYQQQHQQPPASNGGVPTEPPPHVGPPPSCSHGVKKFLAKPYKGGKPGYWMAWACPAQRGDQTQHDLEFIRQN